MENMTDREDDLGVVASLAEPIRRAFYGYVADSTRAVSRDEAADAVGVSRQVAAYHLDRLADDGLVDVEFRRLTGRVGPGAGRPSKLYRRSGQTYDVSIPPRSYELAARILLDAAGEGDLDSTVLAEVARRVGREIGTEGLDAALVRTGYQPTEEDGDTRFRNCPFHALRDQDRATTCGLNLALVEGMVEGSGAEAVARLAPEDGYCCVRLSSHPSP
jgi:predicted ArsR family transcriptional regulator